MVASDKLVSLLVFLQLFASGSGLYCYHCTFNEMSSSNPLLGFILDVFSKISNEACKMENPDLDKYDLDIRRCPVAGSGKVYKCAVISGVIHTSWGFLDVDYNTVERDCLEVPVDDPDYADGSHDSLPSYGPIRTLLDETMASLDLGDPEFDGEAIYSSNSITVSGLQCPRCTWNDLTVDNALVQFLVDGVSLLSSDSCLLQEGDDLYDITYIECRPASFDTEVAVCGEIDGSITTSIIGTNILFRTKTRDCTTVPASSPGSAQAQTSYLGCSQSSNTASVSTILQDTYSGVDLSNANFDGTACYYTDLDSSISASPHPATAGLSTVVTLALIAALVILSC